MTKYIFISVFILTLVGCGHVTFSDPGPSDQKSIAKFTRDFLGNYYCTDSIIDIGSKSNFFNSRYFASTVDKYDTITLFTANLIVTERIVTYSISYSNYMKIDKIDSSMLKKELENQVLYIKGKHLVETITINDTLLDLNKNDKLFFYQGRYYINHYNTSDRICREPSWTILPFEKNSDSIYFLSTTNMRDNKLLVDTLKMWEPIYQSANLSNEQFKIFVDKGGFHQKIKLKKYAP